MGKGKRKNKTKNSKKREREQVFNEDGNKGEQKVTESNEISEDTSNPPTKKQRKESDSTIEGRDSFEESKEGEENEDESPPPQTFHSEFSFNQLPLSPHLQFALKSMGFDKMTHVQSRSIPSILEGKDVGLFKRC